jgi:hypothetical protein
VIVEPVVAPLRAVSAADELVVDPPVTLPPEPLPPGAPCAHAAPDSDRTSEAAAAAVIKRMDCFLMSVSEEGEPLGRSKGSMLSKPMPKEATTTRTSTPSAGLALAGMGCAASAGMIGRVQRA